MEEFNEDDFGELYADVEVQASSAINGMHGMTDTPLEDDRIFADRFPHLLSDDDQIFENATGSEQKGGEGLDGIENTAVNDENYENASGEQHEEEGEGLTELPMENGGNNETGIESEDDLNIILILEGADGRRNEQNYGDNNFHDDNNNHENVVKIESKNARSNNDRGGDIDQQDEMKFGEITYGKETSSDRGDHNSQPKESSHCVAFSRTYSNNGSLENINICGQPMNGSSISGRSGNKFSIPRFKTILDVNIDSLERKPWRNPGSYTNDFFNFGFDEDGWKLYCRDVKKCRGERFIRMSAPKFPGYIKEHEVASQHYETNQSSSTNNATNSTQKENVPSTTKICQGEHKDSIKYSLNSMKRADENEKLHKLEKNRGIDTKNVSYVLDKHGRVPISDSEEDTEHHEVSDCDSDGKDEAMESFDNRQRRNSRRKSGKRTSVVGPESSLSDKTWHNLGESYSPSSWMERGDDETKKSRKISNENDMSYYQYFGGYYPDYHLWPEYLKQYWNHYSDFGYKEGWHDDPNMKENRNFMERKRAKMEYEDFEDDWHYNEMRHTIHDKSIEESRNMGPRYAMRGRGNQFSRRRGGGPFIRRGRYRDFSHVRGYSGNFTRGKYRRWIPSRWRDRNRFDNRFHGRELRSPRRGKKRCDSPDNSWRMEDEERRYVRQRHPSCNQTSGPMRERFQETAGPKFCVPDRHERSSWMERQRENEWYNSRDENLKDCEEGGYHLNEDRVVRRRKYEESNDTIDMNKNPKNHHDISNWNEEEYKYERMDDVMMLTSEEPLSYFDRIASSKGLSDKHTFDDMGKHVDEREVEGCSRYKEIGEGECSNEFDQGPQRIYPDGYDLVHSRYKDPVNRRLVDGEKKSSRRISKVMDGKHKDSYRLMDGFDDQEQENSRDLNASGLDENAVLENERNLESDQHWHNLFFESPDDEFPDIEEGQIIPDEVNNEHAFNCLIASEDIITHVDDEEDFSYGENVVGIDDQCIEEMIAKTLDKDSGDHSETFPDLDLVGCDMNWKD